MIVVVVIVVVNVVVDVVVVIVFVFFPFVFLVYSLFLFCLLIKIISAIINKEMKIGQNNKFSRILTGVQITPDRSTLNNSMRLRSISSAIYSSNDTDALIQSNSTNRINNTKITINNHTNSLITNVLLQPFRITHSNYHQTTTTTTNNHQVKFTNQTEPMKLPIYNFNNSTISNRRQFFNSHCKDSQNLCKFWLQNNPQICAKQYHLMKIQCMRTCQYCTHFDN